MVPLAADLLGAMTWLCLAGLRRLAPFSTPALAAAGTGLVSCVGRGGAAFLGTPAEAGFLGRAAAAAGCSSPFSRKTDSRSTSLPLVSPPSNHSTVTLLAPRLTPDTRAEWIRPLLRWMSTSTPMATPPSSSCSISRPRVLIKDDSSKNIVSGRRFDLFKVQNLSQSQVLRPQLL